MSLRALVEVVVHLESFRNIDLFYQGIYYVQVKLYSKKKRIFIESTDNKRKSLKVIDSTSGSNNTAQAVEGKEQTELSQPYCHFVSFALE